MNGTNAKRCVPSTHYTVTTCSGESTYTVPWPMPPCIMHGRVREHQCRSITVSDRLTTGPFLPRVPAHSSLVCHPPAYGVRRTPPSDPCVVIPTGQGLARSTYSPSGTRVEDLCLCGLSAPLYSTYILFWPFQSSLAHHFLQKKQNKKLHCTPRTYASMHHVQYVRTYVPVRAIEENKRVCMVY
jgi:hypothetical protein